MKTTCTDFYGKKHAVDTSSLINRISAYGIYIADDDVLLIQDPRSLRWELPGGVESQESIVQGLIREFVEEAGVVPGEQFHLLREWTEYFYDTPSKQGWRALRKFYLVDNIENGDLLLNGNGIDAATAQMIPMKDLGAIDITLPIKETIHLAAAHRLSP
ncbi:MAG TPA: NUDIX domain-containing protein [Magnetospirillaceae bacterium]|nr:NUDIX domain-containing protein [Magnetospirillaceae bacterium]